MRRIHFVPVVTLMLSALIFANSPSPQPDPQTRQAPTTAQQFTIERQVSTQRRINRYFHGDVVPKLKDCWSNVQGKGTISLKYTYIRAGGRWMFSRLENNQSTLPGNQANVALRCMSDALRGTSFPVDGLESTENTFVLKWTWPVPFPANAAQLTSAMLADNGGGGGTAGHGRIGRDRAH